MGVFIKINEVKCGEYKKFGSLSDRYSFYQKTKLKINEDPFDVRDYSHSNKFKSLLVFITLPRKIAQTNIYLKGEARKWNWWSYLLYFFC